MAWANHTIGRVDLDGRLGLRHLRWVIVTKLKLSMATSPDEHVGGPEQAFSYIRRRGRFTQAQARAYENLVEQYRVTPEHLIAHSGPVGWK